jgi:ABC-type phosphate transport system permease subunit
VVSEVQAQTYLQALIASVTTGVVMPLLILVIVCVMGWVLFSRAASTENFNIADILRDNQGKPSSERTILFLTWGASTWMLAVTFFALPQHVPAAFGIYMAAWTTNAAVKQLSKDKYGQHPPDEGK